MGAPVLINGIWYNGHLAQSFERKGADLEFNLENIAFVPFYQLERGEPYQMYFDLIG